MAKGWTTGAGFRTESKILLSLYTYTSILSSESNSNTDGVHRPPDRLWSLISLIVAVPPTLSGRPVGEARSWSRVFIKSQHQNSSICTSMPARFHGVQRDVTTMSTISLHELMRRWENNFFTLSHSPTLYVSPSSSSQSSKSWVNETMHGAVCWRCYRSIWDTIHYV